MSESQVKTEKMSIEQAIERVYYLQWLLITGGALQEPTKWEIEDIMMTFTAEEWGQIKIAVKAKFPDQE